MRAYPSRRWLRRVEVAALALFVAVAADVWFGGLGATVDEAVGDWVLANVDAAERAVYDEWLSAPGHTSVAFVVLLLAAAMCVGLGRWFNGALLVGGGTLAILVVESLKLLYARERPLEGLDADAFPSGHVAKAAVVYGLAFALVADALLHRSPGTMAGLVVRPATLRNLAGLWALLVAMTALGRVLSGEHWVTDVVGAFAFSVAAVCDVLALHDRFAGEVDTDRGPPPPPPPSPPVGPPLAPPASPPR